MATFMENVCAFFTFLKNFIVGISIGILYLLKAIFLFFVPKVLRAKDVSNELVLITGGASGIGRLMAINFAKLGANVIIFDLNLPGLEETSKMIEELRSKKDKVGKCHFFQVDISNRFEVYSVAERIKREIGTVTIVVNNAGIVTGKRFMDCQDEKIIKTFEVNTIAHFWILKSFLPGMMEKNHGHIVSIASIAGLVGAYQLTDYCASKFGAVGLEESLRLELCCDGYDGIHSTVVCPYYINTGMFAGISKSLIPILTPQYVADETVKAVRVNQEVLCMPSIVYFLLVCKQIFPTKSFLWFHRAIGAASTMKNFTGRQGNNPANKQKLDLSQNGDMNNKMMLQQPMSKGNTNDIAILMPNQDTKVTIDQKNS